MGILAAAAYVGAFALQALMVFAGNSRFFGLLDQGSGWRTNVEMSVLYTSFVTPAGWAFAIWGVIYTWELVTVSALAASELGMAVPIGGEPGYVLGLWISMNFCQSLWSVLFATERLFASGLALSGIAASLILLGVETTAGASLGGYFAVCAPVWLHAGWTTAAALVNVNLALVDRSASPALQLAAAFGTCYAALAAALGAVVGQSQAGAPYAAALSWALAAVYHKLRHPVASEQANNPAIAAVGEPAREALELTASSCANAISLTLFGILLSAGVEAGYRR